MNTNRFSVRLAGLIASLIFIITFTACATRSENESVDTAPASTAEALVRLDRMMDRADVIAREKSHRLDSLKRSYAAATTPRERYRELEALFSEYRSYSMDTLLLVSRECVKTARQIGNDSLLYNAIIMEAESHKGVGDYTTAMALLDRIPRPWRDIYHRRILNRYCSIYYSLVEHSTTDQDYRTNLACLEAYRDSIIAISKPGSTDYWLNTAAKHLGRNDYKGCLADLDSLEAAQGGRIDLGVLSFTRARSLEGLGRIDEAKYNYAVAAAHDLNLSVRKYEALQELARILSAEGDDPRAFRYIMRAIDDIHASHATSRIQRISTYLPIITASYTDAQEKSARNKNLWLVMSGALLAALCCAVVFAIRKNKRLNHERHALERKNIELENLRARLSEANHRLQESSKVKEQYLGYLFNLCADYIGSLDKYRLQLSQRIKAGKIKDIDAILATPQGPEHLQSFFQKFDSIFLDIFPDFISRFNALMQPGYELEPRPGELLSPELRIYALVRLGITDSSQIAAFLHYSPQTVYNYRFRVRSHARIPREDFPRAVRSL